MKEVKKALYPNKTPPPSFETPHTPFEQRYANYESFDPSPPFAPYVSQAFDAPPPGQPRPNMVDQLAAEIIGDPIPGMATSSHTSFTNTTTPTIFGSSLYIGTRSQWVAPHDYASHDQDDHYNPRHQAPMDSNFLLFG
jgi:hypothetical protein